ncbi:hypothetical protein BN970_05730 [Mycolicibacterium conceptionense]|nr:hypothetical protein BN970_05730 [Mycolicibacterium conceptionense]
MMRAMAARGGGAPQLDFSPADIEVAMSVDAKFVAGEG